MTTGYLETTRNVYKVAAEKPGIGLCRTTTPVWQLPGLHLPLIMQQINYLYCLLISAGKNRNTTFHTKKTGGEKLRK